MAITTEKGITERLVGTVSVQFIDQQTGLMQVLKTPNNFMIDNGVKTKTQEGMDTLGRKVIIDRYTTDVMPEMQVSFPGGNTDILALQQGKRTTKQTGDTIILPIRRQAGKTDYPAIAAGGYGVDITANPTGVIAAAKILGNPPVNLVQQTYATFAGTTPLSYAIGAGGAIKFSDDLVNDRAIVELSVPATVDTQSIGEIDLDYQTVRALVRNSNDSVSILEIPTLQINPEGSKIDPGEDNTEIKGTLLTIGACNSYTFKTIQRRLVCQH